jgi:NhaP-type Na+/H+ or K+/H+ antiporter
VQRVSLDDGPLTLSLAMLTGVLSQVIGRHIRIPGIVLLLVAGVLLGPDGANLIRPEAMGRGLSAVVGFAVAIILFEGGFSLQLGVLRSHALPIRRLVTLGAVVTATLTAIAAKLFMGWDWRLAILFGTLVIVTGPTVVTPLLRRLRVSPRLTSILIAEGILIDAVGATIAVVALEVALAPTRGAAAAGVLSIATRLGAGAAIGLAGGFVLAGLHRVRRLVPHGLENVLVIAAVVVTFHLGNAVVHESGITAAIVLGLVVGNSRLRVEREVAHFNEQLTSLFVATLFVLLAADVRLDDVRALGVPGVAVAGAIIFVVRPANVFSSTYGAGLSVREQLYLSWIAPRGIVAAAVA